MPRSRASIALSRYVVRLYPIYRNRRMRANRWRRWIRRTAYVAAVAVFISCGLELLCRWGAIPNEAARLAKQARRPATRRAIIIGDSFSVGLFPQTYGGR